MVSRRKAIEGSRSKAERGATGISIYDEIVDFIAAGPSSERVASLQPSETTRQHVFDLLAREKSIGLSPEETLELERHLRIEHLMRLARARRTPESHAMSNVDNHWPPTSFHTGHARLSFHHGSEILRLLSLKIGIGELPMPEATLDQRMTAMEVAVRELQDRMKARETAPDWLDRVIGSMKDEPAFDDALAYGRSIRQADRPVDDGGPAGFCWIPRGRHAGGRRDRSRRWRKALRALC